MASEKRKRKANSDVSKKRKRKEEAAEEAEEKSEERSSEALRLLQSAMGLQLSSLELESLRQDCVLEVPNHSDVQILGKTVKAVFGSSWREHLCEGSVVEGKVNPGSPAVLIISSSALRCIHLLRGFRSFTKQCHAAKLFAKHLKLHEQISLLKNRVNIAGGTPSRIKKLIDAEALDLSRLQVLVLDLHPDVKGYSLLTLPQVRDEFLEVFKNYFYEAMIQGGLRICLYGLKDKHKQGNTVPDT